ncbi:hypothetical protein TM48_00839 [Mycobacterium shottsii]|uniref:Uncharacterized protein n=1 Tax=Mycobacterium shottsii TaxID=133549 RepID=A0A7I7L9E9_9MYCO|nr:hypothetical protein [Mycobacterium shottsii]QYL26709.1 hypothetical protein TM48_00839 [Mycobacterium shottsii]BBX56280.1 hypothetical protein MSHO_16250 [Mycobacterium shottsii]
MLSLRWGGLGGRGWSYVVYNVGYRLLSLQLLCGSLAVCAVPFVVKHVCDSPVSPAGFSLRIELPESPGDQGH